MEKTVFNGITVRSTMYLGRGLETDGLPDADAVKEKASLRETYTLKVDFVFDGLTVQEAADMLASTTSVQKMFYNNVAGNWTDDEKAKNCKEVMTVRVHEDLMDIKKSNRMTPEQRANKDIAKMKAAGMTKEQMLAIIEAKFDL